MSLGRYVLEQVRDCSFTSELQPSQGAAPYCGLHYVVMGSGTLTLNKSTALFQEGQYFASHPKDTWNISSSGQEPFRLLSLRFRYSEAAASMLIPASLEKLPLDQRIRCDKGKMEGLLLELADELGDARNSHALLMAESLVSQITVIVHRSYNTQVEKIFKRPDRSDNPKELAFETVRYIDKRLLEMKELSEIAAAFGYSHSRLSQVFRTEMGVSLQHYWGRRRILKAMNLLQSGQKVTRVAELLHYQSIHSFSKAFKKNAGLTPTEYQELYG